MRGIPVISIVLHVPIAFILIRKAESNNNNNNKTQTIPFFIHYKKVQRKILVHYYIMCSYYWCETHHKCFYVLCIGEKSA